ncbi:MAG: hypothetical protein E2O67_02545 [Deltaproteobacteria bacterium]|nr:MAG: hypothetical protein E2O67_02545 [Deltaproteobacteria bacterium]
MLSNLILNVHKANTNRMLTNYTSESVINASGLAQSIIDMIQSKAFDENTIDAAVWQLDSLTAAINLGPESGENMHTEFDDIDDYNNYSTTVSLDRMGDFDINVNVFYVNTLNPQIKSSITTYSKKIELSIINYSLLDTLKYYHIISY